MKKFYSKILHVFIFCFCFLRAEAQYVNIPDANFVSWLNANGYSSCMSGNMMDTTCGAVVNAIAINCSSENINDLDGIQFFDNLQSLICYLNHLTSLPSLPNSLTALNCYNNDLTSLPSLPNSLVDLYCYSNPLNSLPSLPNSLTHLFCALTQLPSLPSLPNSLIHLDCRFNQLTSLPSLPNSLIALQCGDNLLTSLPSLPNSLVDLRCNDNQLTSLPPLPNTLKYIYCEYNQLTSFNSLPNALMYFYCNDNQLTSLPSLPDSVSMLNLGNNPALACFPGYKIINNLYWSNTGITCLPNAGYIGNPTPPISSLPLCQPASGCDFSWNISGRIYHDGNGNCTRDSGELLFKNIPVTLDSGGIRLQTFISNTIGFYSFETGLGNYQISIDTAGLPFEVICPATGEYISTLTAADSLDEDFDFGLQCKPGFDVGVISAARDSGIFRPENFGRLKITAGDISNFFGLNLNCAAGISGAVEVILSGSVSNISVVPGSLVPVVSGDTLLYSIADFGTVNPTTDFRFIVQTDTSAIAGTLICFTVNVTPLTGDLNITNNSLQHCYEVVASLDPNNKEVFPEGDIDTSQHWLTYTVNFQNTGTAPAQHIYILDTLDTDLNAAAFTFLSSSHDVITQMLPGNILRFSFPDINLPDSVSDEPNSHGYVQYKVKLTDGLPPGTVIENTAHIFFDFNAPVTTNTTVNEIVHLTSLAPGPAPKEKGVVLFPNPATQNELTIRFQSSFNTPVTFELSDMTGRKVFSQKMLSSSTQRIIRLPELSNGMYNCVIILDGERVNKKIAVLRK